MLGSYQLGHIKHTSVCLPHLNEDRRHRKSDNYCKKKVFRFFNLVSDDVFRPSELNSSSKSAFVYVLALSAG